MDMLGFILGLGVGCVAGWLAKGSKDDAKAAGVSTGPKTTDTTGGGGGPSEPPGKNK